MKINNKTIQKYFLLKKKDCELEEKIEKNWEETDKLEKEIFKEAKKHLPKTKFIFSCRIGDYRISLPVSQIFSWNMKIKKVDK